MIEIDSLMREEMKKDPMVRDVSPMVPHFCKACNGSMDCSSYSCPLMQAKWFGNYITIAEFALSSGRTEPASPAMPSVTKHQHPEPFGQLSLF